MARSPGFGSSAGNLRAPIAASCNGCPCALFRLAFAAPSPHGLSLLPTETRGPIIQKVRRHRTQVALGRLRLLVGVRFQVCFTPLVGVLFTFPSRYLCTIGRQGVFRLGGWSPHVQTGFHVPRPTQGSPRALRLRGCHPLRRTFPDPSASLAMTTGLLRFRSPLLTESRLMSFPPGTEMFQFPGFASRPYEFRPGYPEGWVSPFGHPRINDRSHLPAAFRSVPRPSSPLGAKASTGRPSLARHRPFDRNNTNQPNPPPPARRTKPRPTSKTTKGQARQHRRQPRPRQSHYATLQAQSYSTNLPTIPVFTCERTCRPAKPPGEHGRMAILEAAAPPHKPTARGAVHRNRPQCGRYARLASGGLLPGRAADGARPGSNGGDRIRTDDPLLAKQVLYQLSYAPRWPPFSVAAIVPHDAVHTAAGNAVRRPGPSKGPDARLAAGGLLSARRSSAESNGPGRT